LFYVGDMAFVGPIKLYFKPDRFELELREFSSFSILFIFLQNIFNVYVLLSAGVPLPAGTRGKG